MPANLRVAFFTDSFHEVNGVALTSRQLQEFAARRGFPFLSVHAGPETKSSVDGSVSTVELQRGSAKFGIESDLSFDPMLWRHGKLVTDAVRRFQPDLVHVTGPGDFGMLGAYVANQCRIPLAASWHTNVHEYAARRLEKLLSFVPTRPLHRISAAAERHALSGTAQFYKIARLLFAPNQELVELLRQRTGKDCHLMQRGVDARLFDPAKREAGERPFTIGYVGRLSAEKNVRLLAGMENAMLLAGYSNFKFVIAGAGSEEGWLRENLRQAEFAGVVKGEALARLYANMDVFAFPSETDTFGNVILEALASGVPCIVTAGGGPKFLVRSGETGFITTSPAAFIRSAIELMSNPELRSSMTAAARRYACSISWDAVFEKVYAAYAGMLAAETLQTAS